MAVACWAQPSPAFFCCILFVFVCVFLYLLLLYFSRPHVAAVACWARPSAALCWPSTPLPEAPTLLSHFFRVLFCVFVFSISVFLHFFLHFCVSVSFYVSIFCWQSMS